ncbi:MAG: ATP-binding protein [Alistipes sp.]
MKLLKFRRDIFSFRNRVVVIVIGILLGSISLLYTNNMAQRLKEKEQHDVELWAHAMERVNQDGFGDSMGNDPLIDDIVDSHNNIPFIITDDNLNVLRSHLIPDEVIDHPDRLRRRVEKMAEENIPILIEYGWSNGHKHIIFYGKSSLLKSLYYFPYIQLCVITIFILLGFIAFRSTKQDEQNRVWIGLAKETAHQLGTPTSSLLGWIEFLRTQPIDQSTVDEMNKDLAHLMKIVDRFSKIGSETPLTPANINEVVSESVMYFRKRIPRNVTLDYNGLATAPLRANINAALFEWVVENLMKNALDALQGHGAIDVKIFSDEKNIIIDVKDTGKGIPKSNWKRIFEPGFTTKTRGWGLGLSLSRRIIEEYHQGHIAVLDSEIGKGTTFRITLKQLFDL